MPRSRVLETRWLDWDVEGRPKVAQEKIQFVEKTSISPEHPKAEKPKE
jgi:hypothetical protein